MRNEAETKEAETKNSIPETVSNQGLKHEKEYDCGVSECTILAKTQEMNKKSFKMDLWESFTIGRRAQCLFWGTVQPHSWKQSHK